MSKRADVYEHLDAASATHSTLRARVDDALSIALVWTPRDELEAKERGDTVLPLADADEEERAQRKMTVKVHQFVLFADFLSAGVTQLEWLTIRSLIMLRICVPGLLCKTYGFASPRAARAEERRLRRGLPREFHPEQYVPLSTALEMLPAPDELELAAELGLDLRQYRILSYGEFCVAIAEVSRDIVTFAKSAASMVRRVKGEFVEGLGASQADFGRKFREERATVQVREKKVVERPFNGASAVHLLGGTKSNGHREACAAAQIGNTNRRDGLLRSRGLVDDTEWREQHNHIPLRARVSQAQMDALWSAHERGRIATLAGVQPEEIDLQMSSPSGKISGASKR